MQKPLQKDSVNSWEHYGILMHSTHYTLRSTSLNPTKHALEYDKLSVMDKWLLSKMNTMVKSVDDNLGNYRIPEAARALQEFVDDMVTGM